MKTVWREWERREGVWVTLRVSEVEKMKMKMKCRTNNKKRREWGWGSSVFIWAEEWESKRWKYEWVRQAMDAVCDRRQLAFIIFKQRSTHPSVLRISAHTDKEDQAKKVWTVFYQIGPCRPWPLFFLALCVFPFFFVFLTSLCLDQSPLQPVWPVCLVWPSANSSRRGVYLILNCRLPSFARSNERVGQT